MAVGSMGGVLSAASSFLSFAALRAGAPEAPARAVEPVADAIEPGLDDPFAPGSAGYEAVADALDRAGYLDA